jgi:uncharacterized surface protein with fasciclin (FAS1) repeats
MYKLVAIAAAAAAALAGCQADEAGNNAAAPANSTQAAAAPSGNLAQAVAGSARFRQAVEAAGLEATLTGPGPYTVLVPADAAFAKLPANEIERLMQPAAKPELTAVLTYHILPGTILTADLQRAIQNGGGKAVLATMAGKTVTATGQGDRIILTDQAGRQVALTGAEKLATNGVVHEIDGVLLPATGPGRPN